MHAEKNSSFSFSDSSESLRHEISKLYPEITFKEHTIANLYNLTFCMLS